MWLDFSWAPAPFLPFAATLQGLSGAGAQTNPRLIRVWTGRWPQGVMDGEADEQESFVICMVRGSFGNYPKAALPRLTSISRTNLLASSCCQRSRSSSLLGWSGSETCSDTRALRANKALRQSSSSRCPYHHGHRSSLCSNERLMAPPSGAAETSRAWSCRFVVSWAFAILSRVAGGGNLAVSNLQPSKHQQWNVGKL